VKNIPNMGNLLKQAQKIQSQISKLQEELEQKTVEASSGGGMVTVVVNGKQEVLSIKIDPEVVTSDDIEMLQDLIVAAINEGLSRAREMISDEMGKLTQGLGLPNIPGLI